jgi:anti-anti-sigma factor
MKVESTRIEGALLVTVTGRMDAAAAPQFERACDAWLGQGERDVVVDMRATEYISSMGLRSLLMLAKSLQRSGGRLALCGLAGPVREVFRISGLLPIFSVFDTPEAALGSAR